MDCIHAVYCRVSVGNVSCALDSSVSPHLHRQHEYAPKQLGKECKYLPCCYLATPLKYCVPYTNCRKVVLSIANIKESPVFPQLVFFNYNTSSSVLRVSVLIQICLRKNSTHSISKYLFSSTSCYHCLERNRDFPFFSCA